MVRARTKKELTTANVRATINSFRREPDVSVSPLVCAPLKSSIKALDLLAFTGGVYNREYCILRVQRLIHCAFFRCASRVLLLASTGGGSGLVQLGVGTSRVTVDLLLLERSRLG